MTVSQGYFLSEKVSKNGIPVFSSALSNEVTPADTVLFNASRAFAGHPRQTSTQTYSYSDSHGNRYHRTVKAEKGLVTSIAP